MLAAGLLAASGGALHLPEHRPLALYDSKRRLRFLDSGADSGAGRADPALAARLLRVRLAHGALDDALAAADPALGEGSTSWQRYLGLPRTTTADKCTAEVFRVLRVLRIAMVHAQGRIEEHEGLVLATCTFGRCALALGITEIGLELLCSFAAFRLAAPGLPYSAAYIDWMLAQYYADIVGEIRRFSDEDRVLFQFQPRPFFNRHFRYDCDNPRVKMEDDCCAFEINRAHDNPLLFPIDFFAVLDEHLHIVPVEATQGGRIARAQLGSWKARCADGVSLPAGFRARFARERSSTAHPMT